MSSVLDAGPCVRSNQLDFDDEVAFAAERSLFGHIRSGDERPFCYVVSFSHPHDPFTISRSGGTSTATRTSRCPPGGRRGAPAPTRAPAPRGLRMNGVGDHGGITSARGGPTTARISYVDEPHVPAIGLLRDTGRLDHRSSIVTSDHGEMLGERGAWYKMSFLRGRGARALIVRAPALFPPGRVRLAWSTMDLLPTLSAGHDGDLSGIVGPLDGRSLLPHLSGTPPNATRWLAEYLAEGAIAPIVMIRRGRHKFIHSPADPDQLFDLASDPYERANLAGDPASAALAAEFRREVAARWDLAALDREVRRASGGGSPSARRSAPAHRPRGTSPRPTTPRALHPQPHGPRRISRRWPASRRPGASRAARRRDRSRLFRRRA
jgi:choline-sulfatase